MVAAQCILQFIEEFRAPKRVTETQFGRVRQNVEHQSQSTQAYRTNTVKLDGLVFEIAPRFAEESREI